MKMLVKAGSVLAACAVFAGQGQALADRDEPDPYGHAWRDDRLGSGIGISAVLGAGISGFTGETMRDTLVSDVGGLWNLRVTIGSHTPLAIDIGYVGTVATIDALLGSESGTLFGTAVEGALRFNALPQHAWNPYAFAGIGWQRYDVADADLSLSDSGMNESDNSAVFPLGAGITYRDASGLVADLRGTVRLTADPGLVLEPPGSSDYASLHTWEASAALGYEF